MLSDKEKDRIIEELKLQKAYAYKFNNPQIKMITDCALNLIEKQSKEIEELKEDRKKYAEEYIHNNPWLYKQLNENYILRVESEQRERGEYIKGTNDADELCNKKWEDKIKAKIEEVKDGTFDAKIVLQSLLEKE